MRAIPLGILERGKCQRKLMPAVGVLALVLAVGEVMVPATAHAEEAEKYQGPCALALSKDGKTLYAACADARQVAWVDLATRKVTRRVDLPAEPTGLVTSTDGAKLIVTCAAPKSTVVVLDAASGKTLASIRAGHTAMGPAITPDGKRLYVCNRFDNDVSVIDLAGCKELARVKAVREPVAAAVTPDGKSVFVANHLPNTRTDLSFFGTIAAVVTVIDTQTNKTTAVELRPGSHSLRDLCMSHDGKHVYVSHLLCNFEMIPTQVDGGWIHSNVFTVIDTRERKLINTVGLDGVFSGVGNPWGVVCTADGKSICISQAGTHQLSIVDTPAALGELIQMFTSPWVGAIAEDEGAGTRAPYQIKLPGKGPRAMAVRGKKVFIAEYFSDTVAVVDLAAQRDDPVDAIALGPKPKLSLRRRGEMLFNDATICYGHWQSCASCHPDGRTDALNWDLLNDGAGNPKSTKSMVLAFKTPPVMAEGIRPTAQAAVRAGIEHILFTTRPDEEPAAIDEYLKSLKPVASPHLVDGRLSPAAERGKRLFEGKLRCRTCHPAPLYTDLKLHNVGTKSMYSTTERLDTPTLREVWRSAPYLHDGRYLTVKELIVKGKHGKSRGGVDKLTKQEIDDLVEFVLSL